MSATAANSCFTSLRIRSCWPGHPPSGEAPKSHHRLGPRRGHDELSARSPSIKLVSVVVSKGLLPRTLPHEHSRTRSTGPAAPLPMQAAFVTAQGSAYMRFRRALDRGNVTEALSAASEASIRRWRRRWS